MHHSPKLKQIFALLVQGGVVCGTLGVSSLYSAQELGRVLSSTPVVQQVGIPHQVCSSEQVAIQQPTSGAGAAIGAIAGGALGSTAGHGAGRAAATMIGAIGGAVIGDRIEGPPPVQMQNVNRCSQQIFYENRTVAYNVVYEFAGKQYAVQMPHDPGPTLAVQVTAVGAAPQLPAPIAPVTPVYAPPLYATTPVTVVTQSSYPVYYARPYLPAVQLNWGYRGWGGYEHHRHWR